MTTPAIRALNAVLRSGLILSALTGVCQAQKPAACDQSTVDENHDQAYSAKAKEFLATLQQVVKNADKKQFARLVRYPLRVNGQRTMKITSSSALISDYSEVLPTAVKDAIAAQSSDCLFANAQGVMIGNGQVWYDEDASGKMKIVSINLTAPEVSGQPKSPDTKH